MSLPPSSPSALIIDPEAIDNLRSLSPDDGDVFLREILTIFLTDTPERIADLHSNRISGNTAAFIRAAHSIKGSSSNVGAIELRALAEKTEHHTRLNGLGSIDQHVAEIEAAFTRAQAIIEKIITPN